MGNMTSRDPQVLVPMMKLLAERRKVYRKAEKAIPARSKKALKTVSDLLEKVIKDVKDKQKMRGNGMCGSGMCNCGMCDVCYGGTLGTPDSMMSQTFLDGVNLVEPLPDTRPIPPPRGERIPRPVYTGERAIISNPIRSGPVRPLPPPKRGRPISNPIRGGPAIPTGTATATYGSGKSRVVGEGLAERRPTPFDRYLQKLPPSERPLIQAMIDEQPLDFSKRNAKTINRKQEIMRQIRLSFQNARAGNRPRVVGEGLKKSRKGNSKAKARGQMVSELMKKENLTLGQASKKLASMNK